MGRARNEINAVAATAMRTSREPKVALPTANPDLEWYQPDTAVRMEAKQIGRQLGYDEATIMRLVMKGMNAEEIYAYLNPSPQHIVSPEDTVGGMIAGAQALSDGIKNGDGVAIYGDYDVDGETSMAILASTLKEYDADVFAGSATAATGFGLSREFVEKAHADGAKWLITVDCGSTQTEPILLAQSLGMKVIVLDHHMVDTKNTAEFHLNPRLRATQAMETIHAEMSTNEGIHFLQRKWEIKEPYMESIARITDRSEEILKGSFGEDEYKQLVKDVKDYGHPTNTGSMLTWKFAAEFHRTRNAEVPAHHWGTPLYLAGIGAIADMAPSDNQEVRAFVRVPTDFNAQSEVFGNDSIVPIGIQAIADQLVEDTGRPDSLIRTRALMNLPKRVTEIDPEDIQTLMLSKYEEEIKKLAPEIIKDYERLSAIRRDEMDPQAMEQIELSRAAGEQTYFNYVALKGFEDYAGYARMVANNAARKTGRPTIAFTRKGVDEFGQELWKYSAANDCVPGAKLGDLIPNEAMIEASTIKQRNWLGNEADIPNLGGHVEVASGVCTTENIDKVKKAVEAWAEEKAEKGKWVVIDRHRPRVVRRKVHPSKLERLEKEAKLLAPLKFPENTPVQVSVVASYANIRKNAETEQWEATMKISDKITRQVLLSPDNAAVAKAYRGMKFESVIAMGGSGPYYISHMATMPSAKRSYRRDKK